MTQKPPPDTPQSSTPYDDSPPPDPDSFLNFRGALNADTTPPSPEPISPDTATSDNAISGDTDSDADATQASTPKPAQSSTLSRPRHDGWSRVKMRRFLENLASTASVTDAAKAVGLSRQSAYGLRARLMGTPFDLAWETALEHGLRQLAHAALDRAINGVEEDVYYHGEVVGKRRAYDERLTRFMLSNPSRVGRHPLAREHGAQQWDLLLNRVEGGSLDWQDAEEDSEEAKAAAAEARAFVTQRSDYVAGRVWELGAQKDRQI